MSASLTAAEPALQGALPAHTPRPMLFVQRSVAPLVFRRSTSFDVVHARSRRALHALRRRLDALEP